MSERLTAKQIREKKYPSFFHLSDRMAALHEDAAAYVMRQAIDIPFADHSKPPLLWLPGVLTQEGLARRAEKYERAQEVLQLKENNNG